MIIPDLSFRSLEISHMFRTLEEKINARLDAAETLTLARAAHIRASEALREAMLKHSNAIDDLKAHIHSMKEKFNEP